MKNFSDRLLEAIDLKQNPSVIGMDPDMSKIPGFLREEFKSSFGDTVQGACNCMLAFNKAIIDSIREIVPAVKIQSAFYEQYGPQGIKAFSETAEYAKEKGLIVIADVKRNDIGNTSEAYSNAYLGEAPLLQGKKSAHKIDCITVNPYLGSDGIKPFISDAGNFGKGVFVLVKTSNPSSSELQDLVCDGKKVYELVGSLVDGWGNSLIGERGYSSVGAAVGATYPGEAESLRKIMPKAIFLVPGYGAQGGGASDVVPCFNKDGYGAIVNSSRGVIFAFEKSGKEEEFARASAQAAQKMKEDIARALSEKGILPW